MRLISDSEHLAYNLGSEILNTFAADCSDKQGLDILSTHLMHSVEALREQEFDAVIAHNHKQADRLRSMHRDLLAIVRCIETVNKGA